VLESREVDLLGENLPREVDVRVVAASNQNIDQMVADGKFREDLYHRLNVIRILVPPLRERGEDILPLAYHFLHYYNDNHNRQVQTLSAQAEGILLNHHWPGNVRELKNVMEKLVIFAEKSEIDIDDVLQAMGNEHTNNSANGNKDEMMSLRSAQESFQKRYILQMLHRCKWKMTDTARALSIDRSNLFKKMRKLGIKK
jgi:DNA-binding NtrC family response regulator